jgi:hypothetical protein
MEREFPHWYKTGGTLPVKIMEDMKSEHFTSRKILAGYPKLVVGEV